MNNICELVNITLNNNECGLITSFLIMLIVFVGVKLKYKTLEKDDYDSFQVNILTSILVAFSINSLLYILTTKDVYLFVYFIFPISIILIAYLFKNNIINTIKIVAQFSMIIFIVSLVYTLKEDSSYIGFYFACLSGITILATLYLNSYRRKENQSLEVNEIKSKVQYLVTVEEQI